ncbi:MAG TPA: hypothetical protein DFR83_27465, partial [Deltaproteobacteria bacterium]|nr:hypothetical protein [Deltaproteobacteria bacterium]
PLERSGLARWIFDPDRLVWCARRATGLRDLGERSHPEGLAVACASLRLEAGLDVLGQLVVGNALIESVSNRLRYVDGLARVPQRFEVPLTRPLFIVGLPRSGTTLLQRLLCAAPGTRGIPLWQATQPIVGRHDRRRRRLGWRIGFLRAALPGLMSKHAFELDSAEEAINLFESAGGWNPFLWRIASCHGYVRWMLEQDANTPYACFVDLLRWIAAPTPDRRLVLKTPDHLGYLTELHALLPDAIFVRVHRDASRCVSSYASLSATMHSISARSIDSVAIGRTSLAIWAQHSARADAAQVPVIDVDYEALCSDPLATVAWIHARAGLRWSREERVAILEEIARRPAGRFGRHVYALRDYGLTDDMIRTQFRLAARTQE